jgi:hypothetical protein
MSAKVNITVDQGADFVYNTFLIDSGGNPIDLTDFTGRSQFRTSFTSPNYTNVHVTVGTTDGSVVLSMNATTTATLTSSRYVYDLELISVDNIVSRVMEGTVTVNPNVTR